jgi:hypothetical protein
MNETSCMECTPHDPDDSYGYGAIGLESTATVAFMNMNFTGCSCGNGDGEGAVIYAKESGVVFSCAYITFLKNEGRQLFGRPITARQLPNTAMSSKTQSLLHSMRTAVG